MKGKKMKNKQFELQGDTFINQKREFTTQITNDNLFLNPITPDECFEKIDIEDYPRPKFGIELDIKNKTKDKVTCKDLNYISKESSVLTSPECEYFNSIRNKNDLEKLFLRHRKNIFDFYYNGKLLDKMNNMVNNNKVVYDGSSLSVDLLLELVNDTKGINNCHDFKPTPKLLFNDIFFDVGTEFRLHDGNIMTRDTKNFGYEFKGHELIRTINWINLD